MALMACFWDQTNASGAGKLLLPSSKLTKSECPKGCGDGGGSSCACTGTGEQIWRAKRLAWRS